jgi:hypothetical protein
VTAFVGVMLAERYGYRDREGYVMWVMTAPLFGLLLIVLSPLLITAGAVWLVQKHEEKDRP